MACVAVIPARRAEWSIAATLESLRIGNHEFVERVLVVTSVDDPTADVVRRWAARDGRVELLAFPAPLSAGAARNAGRAAIATGAAGSRPMETGAAGSRPMETGAAAPLLLFIDADCSLEAGGAARLAGELARRGAAAVCARVLTGGGAVARTRHILEFKEAASRRAAPRNWLPPSTAMMCRADAFDGAGGFPDLWPGEDLVFSQALRDLGELVQRSDEVAVVHRHPRGVGEMLRHQRRLGLTAAIARRSRRMPGSAFARNRWRAALLLPARGVRIAAWQAREGGAALGWALLLSPLLAGGLVAWTFGFIAGAGTASAPDRLGRATCA